MILLQKIYPSLTCPDAPGCRDREHDELTVVASWRLHSYSESAGRVGYLQRLVCCDQPLDKRLTSLGGVRRGSVTQQLVELRF